MRKLNVCDKKAGKEDENIVTTFSAFILRDDLIMTTNFKIYFIIADNYPSRRN